MMIDRLFLRLLRFLPAAGSNEALCVILVMCRNVHGIGSYSGRGAFFGNNDSNNPASGFGFEHQIELKSFSAVRLGLRKLDGT